MQQWARLGPGARPSLFAEEPPRLISLLEKNIRFSAERWEKTREVARVLPEGWKFRASPVILLPQSGKLDSSLSLAEMRSIKCFKTGHPHVVLQMGWSRSW
jgi:hypothetical protein